LLLDRPLLADPMPNDRAVLVERLHRIVQR